MNIDTAEQTAYEAAKMFENKEISKEEYLNILQGLEVENVIAENTEDMDRKLKLQAGIQVAISAVSMLA